MFPSAIKIEAAYAISARARALFNIKIASEDTSHVWLAVHCSLAADDALHRQRLQHIAQLTGLPLVAAGHVHMHVRSRKPLHDVLTAIRVGTPVAQCGFELQPNAELHLRSRARLAQLYPAQWLANTLVVAERCTFQLQELRYHYPLESVLPGCTPAQTLRRYVEEGALQRYAPVTHPHGMPEDLRQRVEHELALIAELKFEMYFLTVHDIVRFARSKHILCQGRGSAANSAVCYVLGITSIKALASHVVEVPPLDVLEQIVLVLAQNGHGHLGLEHRELVRSVAFDRPD